jgi:hypothetical protein
MQAKTQLLTRTVLLSGTEGLDRSVLVHCSRKFMSASLA